MSVVEGVGWGRGKAGVAGGERGEKEGCGWMGFGMRVCGNEVGRGLSEVIRSRVSNRKRGIGRIP